MEYEEMYDIDAECYGCEIEGTCVGVVSDAALSAIQEVAPTHNFKIVVFSPLPCHRKYGHPENGISILGERPGEGLGLFWDDVNKLKLEA